MPSFEVRTPQRNYHAIVERGILARAAEYVPAKSGAVFVVSTDDVWRHQGEALAKGLANLRYEKLFFQAVSRTRGWDHWNPWLNRWWPSAPIDQA